MHTNGWPTRHGSGSNRKHERVGARWCRIRVERREALVQKRLLFCNTGSAAPRTSQAFDICQVFVRRLLVGGDAITAQDAGNQRPDRGPIRVGGLA